MSSAKNFILDFISFSRSFIYIRNNRGPKTEPWGTPDSIWRKSEYEPFTATRCLRFVKYEESTFTREPEIPFCFSLKIKPSCQTLSNAFEYRERPPSSQENRIGQRTLQSYGRNRVVGLQLSHLGGNLIDF